MSVTTSQSLREKLTCEDRSNPIERGLANNENEARTSSPLQRGLSPDVLKRIIEGHESTEIFEECFESRDYDEKADLLVHELTKYIYRFVSFFSILNQLS